MSLIPDVGNEQETEGVLPIEQHLGAERPGEALTRAVGVLAAVLRPAGLVIFAGLVANIALAIHPLSYAGAVSRHLGAGWLTWEWPGLGTSISPTLRAVVNSGIAAVIWLVFTAVVTMFEPGLRHRSMPRHRVQPFRRGELPGRPELPNVNEMRPPGQDTQPRAHRDNGMVLTAPGTPPLARREGDRLGGLFEEICDRHAGGERVAVDTGNVRLTYRELDQRANQLARYLLDQGVRAGDRVGALVDRPVDGYLAMLATVKVHAAYVPLDPGFPAERIAYVLFDAEAVTLLGTGSAARRVEGLLAQLVELGMPALWLDERAEAIADHSPARLRSTERGEPVDDLAYIIYTSGSTGRPKGVAVEHASICNFIRVAASVYGIRPTDRVYQGMTIAFDFSVEETWVPWMSGATLVPKPPGASLLGAELAEFLASRHVSALCCVPTLLATLDRELPELRFLLVSGEACPADLISRWHTTGRRFLNVYGPTEATVTATWTVCQPGRPVTIGVPLPSYSIVILDPDNPHRVLPRGELGEIGIAGIGLARGYVNRPEQTEKVFIDDFVGIPDNPSKRIYRTGDLGRINDDGEIDYQGRIDLQVKIRGYRIELTEIESVLLGVPGVGAAVVNTYQADEGVTELVAYYSPRSPAEEVDPRLIYQRLRENLPAYMVPAYLQRLDVIPMTTSDKADRKNLPPPTTRYTGAVSIQVNPVGETERALAHALAATLGLPAVSVTSHFFDELGASSLLMAQFCARARQYPQLPPLAIRDIYQNPTVRQLAAAIPTQRPGDPTESRAAGRPTGANSAGIAGDLVTNRQGSVLESGELARTSSVGYVLTGVGQLMVFLAGAFASALLLTWGYRWVSSAEGWLAAFERAVAFSALGFAAVCILPIGIKWVLVGHWRSAEIPLWSLAYLRFWVVSTLVRVNPLVLFAGSPLYTLYLRALGAKIGRNVVVFAPPPVVTDLITIGDDTVIRQRCAMSGYRALPGRIQTGPITLGAGVVVGENTVLDIDTSMGDHTQLGHASALRTGQRVPSGQSWHGSPAQPCTVNYRRVAPAPCGNLRKITYAGLQLLTVIMTLAVFDTGADLALNRIPIPTEVLGPDGFVLTDPRLYVSLALGVGIVCLGVLVLGALTMLVVPRILKPLIRPGRVYPLYGVAFIAAKLIEAITNSTFLVLLLGDSSFIVHFVRGLGYDLGNWVQTGSNFGTQHRHDSPFLTTVGAGTMISDGLTVMNAEYSNTSFALYPVHIGADNFLGNNVVFPAGARTGDNCLLATKALIPIDGPIRQGVGLLGSPSFEIPRNTAHRGGGDGVSLPGTEVELRQRLNRKNWHNASTIVLVLVARWVGLCAGITPLAIAATMYSRYEALALAVGSVLSLLAVVVYSAVMERAALGFQSLKPRCCTIYDHYFWRHERLWKFYTRPILRGTPFQTLIGRLAGLRVGRRVFDDGCTVPEKTLVSIGDDAVLNNGSIVQCHSLEDGHFQSDRSWLGRRACLGVNAFVHYGVGIGDGAILAADSYLMKGQQIPPGEQWGGNPAGPAPAPGHVVPARRPAANAASSSSDRQVPEPIAVTPRLLS